MKQISPTTNGTCFAASCPPPKNGAARAPPSAKSSTASSISPTANEPNLTMVAKGQPPRYMPEVTNHLMKPCYFGMVPTLPYTIPAIPYVAATQSSPEIPAVAAVEVTDPPFGLQPFYNTDGSIAHPNDPWVQQ